MLFISSQKLFLFSRYLNFLTLLFGHVEKMAWLEMLISKFMASQTINKQLQYIYCPISLEVKATRQWDFVNW